MQLCGPRSSSFLASKDLGINMNMTTYIFQKAQFDDRWSMLAKPLHSDHSHPETVAMNFPAW